MSNLRIATAVCGVLLLAAGAVIGSPAPNAEASRDCTIADAVALDSHEREFLTLINNYRVQNGRQPLTVSYNLTKAAAYKSWDMGTYNYFSHDDLDRTWIQRIRDCNYSYNTYIGENIAAGYTTAAAVFEGWRNSPGHNSNMLSTSFTAIGIGRHQVAGSTFGVYWTTVFGGANEGWAEVAGDIGDTTPIEPQTESTESESSGTTGDAVSSGAEVRVPGAGAPSRQESPRVPIERKAGTPHRPDPGAGDLPWWFRLDFGGLHFWS